MTKYLSAKDVLAVQTQRLNKRSESFDKILEKCYKTIKKSVEILRNNYNCLFEVPEFLIGYPLYDLNECIQFVVQKLTENGFYVKYFFPRILYIYWGQPQTQTQTQPQLENLKKPIDKKPEKKQPIKSVKFPSKKTGKFVLDLT